jgi:sulfur-oxidizing protein SoxY
MRRCWRGIVAGLGLLLLMQTMQAQQSAADNWSNLLKPHYFKDIEIVEDKTVFDLMTPYRAEDAAVTPVRIKAAMPQTPGRYIQAIYLFVDANPEPLVGRFEFTPRSGRADLALRVRIDRYTNVRAVAVLNTGEHHMVTNFVKAQGGCAAPLATDYGAAMKHLGDMQIRALGTHKGGGDEIATQLMIRHPNITGMQMDYRIYAVRPAHYIKTVRVMLDGEPILSAETGISVSEDPSFRFFLRARDGAKLTAEVTDSKGKRWTRTLDVAGM